MSSARSAPSFRAVTVTGCRNTWHRNCSTIVSLGAIVGSGWFCGFGRWFSWRETCPRVVFVSRSSLASRWRWMWPNSDGDIEERMYGLYSIAPILRPEGARALPGLSSPGSVLNGILARQGERGAPDARPHAARPPSRSVPRTGSFSMTIVRPPGEDVRGAYPGFENPGNIRMPSGQRSECGVLVFGSQRPMRARR